MLQNTDIQALASIPEPNNDRPIVPGTGKEVWNATKLSPLEPRIRRTSRLY